MTAPYPLFSRFGVELEYMIVDAETLDVRPLADRVLEAAAGQIVSDVDVGALNWSNELVLHVIELKTGEPAATLNGLAEQFQQHVRRVNDILRSQGARLLPGAAHPWMDPHTQTVLWPHEYNAVYEAFHRIFDCRGHGWSNLQCIHLNLPFANDAEFGRLHAAIRLVLPLLPALAASSPILDGRLTGHADSRLAVYRTNAAKVPSVSGRVIPEPVYTKAAYKREILGRIYADLAPHDPDGILREEWVNARGAIARFDRNTIEIRVVDIQECPAADLAVVSLITDVLRSLVQERWCPAAAQQAFSVDQLEPILLATIRDADAAVIKDAAYLEVLGVRGAGGLRAGDVWQHLFEATGQGAAWDGPVRDAMHVMLKRGCLARRIVGALKGDMSRANLQRTYRRLAECLAEGTMFDASRL